jgi:hypothetical protein
MNTTLSRHRSRVPDHQSIIGSNNPFLSPSGPSTSNYTLSDILTPPRRCLGPKHWSSTRKQRITGDGRADLISTPSTMTGVRALGNCIGTSSSATERLGDVASSRRSPTRSRDSTNRFSGVHKHRAPRLSGERSNSKHDDAAKHKRKVSTGKITHDAHLVFAKDALYHEATCKLRYGPQHPGMRAEQPFEKISMDPNSNHRALSMDTTLGGRHQADQIRKVPTLRALDGHARCCAADRGSLQRQLEHRQLMQIEKKPSTMPTSRLASLQS